MERGGELHFVFLLISLVAIHVFAGGCASKQAAGNREVLTGDVQRLQQIYETPIPVQIREAFSRTTRHICSKDHERCSGCAFTVSDGGKRVDIFTRQDKQRVPVYRPGTLC